MHRFRPLAVLAFVCFAINFPAAQSDSAAPPAQAATQPGTQAPAPQAIPSDIPVFHSTVRRVIVDVVVRDNNNKAVHGLTDHDFQITEDGRPQNILSFDVHDFDTPSISLPPNSPHLSTNNYVNIPPTPERGPLYVLLYDLVNTEIADQIDARRQLLKFIKAKPEGSRFALFVNSDELALVQGFTSDKDLLYAALDPQHPKPHVPKVFMMGKNLGFGDPASTMNILTQVTQFLEGIPGHKNLIWLASTFPLALVPRKEDPREYVDAIHNEINILTRAEVAVYPINVGGVPVNPPGQLTGARVHGGAANQNVQAGGQISGASAQGGSSGGGINSLEPGPGQSLDTTGVLQASAAQGSGDSAITDYQVQQAISEATGGRAFWSTNDVTAALDEATEIDGNYYTITYSPTNQNDDDKRRSIRVSLAQKGNHLSYRRFYFPGAFTSDDVQAKAKPSKDQPASPTPVADNDSLQPNMKHGAPMVHDLIFAAHVHTEGTPAQATPELLAKLSTEPYFVAHSKDKHQAAVELQTYAVDYRVSDPALKNAAAPGAKPPSFEFAAAAYDSAGVRLNGIVNEAQGAAAPADTGTATAAGATKSNLVRVRQEISVPANAAWIRIGVRDKRTNRVGTLELQLPLAPEPPK